MSVTANQTVGTRSEAGSATGSIVLLTRLARVVYRHSTADLLGLRLKELAALAYLRDHADATQQALSDGLCVDANSCVLLLNELEASGYVERRRDPDDRRRHRVVVTASGLTALEDAEAAQAGIEDEVLGALGRDERASLQALLTKALEGQPPVAAPG